MLGKNPDIKDCKENYSFVGQTDFNQIAEFLYIFRNMSARFLLPLPRYNLNQMLMCVCQEPPRCFSLRAIPRNVPSNAVLVNNKTNAKQDYPDLYSEYVQSCMQCQLSDRPLNHAHKNYASVHWQFLYAHWRAYSHTPSRTETRQQNFSRQGSAFAEQVCE